MTKRTGESQLELVGLVADLLDELDGTAVTECEFRAGDRRVYVRRSLAASPAVHVEAPAQDSAIPDTWRPLVSPLTGIFYFTESPQGPPLVSVGAFVAEKQVVGLIESMKMYNPVETDVAGIVRAIEAQASAIVEKGQVLMYVEPIGDTT
jgi:acetyl-CoA carboxylase biotin carboxyl carrier protein